MPLINTFSARKFDFYRTVIGAILAVLFLHMLCYYQNLFLDNEKFKLPLLLGIILALMFALNIFRKVAAAVLIVLLCALTNESQALLRVIAGYLGYFLIFSLAVPSEEGSMLRRKANVKGWKIPENINLAFLLVIAFSMTFSGLSKLQNQEWLNGNALWMLKTNPRMNVALISTLSPPLIVFQILNYAVIGIEIAFLPLYLYRGTRKIALGSLLLLFFGMLVFMKIPILLTVILVFITMLVETGEVNKAEVP